MCERSVSVDKQEEYIISLAKSGGPEPNQYEELNQWFQIIGERVRNGEITQDHVTEIRESCIDAFSKNTMQGFALNKPHGYAGDFEIIDRIYTEWVSPQENLINWDKFFHWQKAPRAVRNRKEYFKGLLSEIEKSVSSTLQVLNIGSGPCRDIAEYHSENLSTKIQFECLDMDKRAIEYSKSILDGIKVKHYCVNAFRFKTDKKYDLVWSAGLFDYLEEKHFVFLLRSLLTMVSPGGELVIGNFSKSNPSRDYMEIGGEWFLFYRTEDELAALAEQSGCNPGLITIDKEPLGINLFMRIRKS